MQRSVNDSLVMHMDIRILNQYSNLQLIEIIAPNIRLQVIDLHNLKIEY